MHLWSHSLIYLSHLIISCFCSFFFLLLILNLFLFSYFVSNTFLLFLLLFCFCLHVFYLSPCKGNMLALVDDGRQPQRITLRDSLTIFINYRWETKFMSMFPLFSVKNWKRKEGKKRTKLYQRRFILSIFQYAFKVSS